MFRKMLSLFRRIDRVQHQVDDLIDTLDGTSGSHDDFLRKNYNLNSRQCQRLGIMILKLQDECLPARLQRQFDRMIQTHTGAARYYFDFQELTFILFIFYCPETMQSECFRSILSTNIPFE